MRTITIGVRSMALFAVGALVAVAVMVMFMSAWRADAAPGAKDTTLVPVTPCRLVDTSTLR